MRKLTEKQAAASAERKERFRALSKRLAGMSDAERAKWQAEAGLVVTIDGRSLSPRNTIMCYFQRQGVTMVGGFRQWIKAGRAVRKGEHGMSILVPCMPGKDRADDDAAQNDSVRFIAGTVFDVSQTNALPNVDIVEHSGADCAESVMMGAV